MAHAEPDCRSADWIASAYSVTDRYELLDPCVTISGPILNVWREAPELGGEYHVDLIIDVGDGKGWVDTELPNPSDYAGLPAIRDWSATAATVTGALVIDWRYGWRSLKPAWAVAGYLSMLRQYNEELPDGSWQMVTQWTDGHYTAIGISTPQ